MINQLEEGQPLLIAQIMDFPALKQALRLAGNSMDANSAFKLKAWLGLDPVRPSIYMAVCMLRAALKTLAEFDTMHIELKNLAFECLPFAFGSKTIIPPGWDSDAFCTNLYKARRLESNNQIWQARARIHNIICEWRAGRGNRRHDKYQENMQIGFVPRIRKKQYTKSVF